MVSGRTAARMVLAALLSGVTAGMLLVLRFWTGLLLVPSAASWSTFATLIDWLEIGIVAGLVVATLPALLAGASLWTLGAGCRAARHPLAWAAAGAGVGGAMWTLSGPVLGSLGPNGLDLVDTALLAASLLAGAGAALAFLAGMRLTGGPARTGGRA